MKLNEIYSNVPQAWKDWLNKYIDVLEIDDGVYRGKTTTYSFESDYGESYLNSNTGGFFFESDKGIQKWEDPEFILVGRMVELKKFEVDRYVSFNHVDNQKFDECVIYNFEDYMQSIEDAHVNSIVFNHCDIRGSLMPILIPKLAMIVVVGPTYNLMYGKGNGRLHDYQNGTSYSFTDEFELQDALVSAGLADLI